MHDWVDATSRHERHSRHRRARRIESRYQPFPSRLTRDRSKRGVCVARGGISRLRAVSTCAAIHVANLHATLLVHCHIKKVEQVPADIGATLHPNATALYWRIRSKVFCSPGRAAIERLRDIEVPDAAEAIARLRTRRCRA